MKNTRRIIAVLLCILMTASVFAFNASASDRETYKFSTKYGLKRHIWEEWLVCLNSIPDSDTEHAAMRESGTPYYIVKDRLLTAYNQENIQESAANKGITATTAYDKLTVTGGKTLINYLNEDFGAQMLILDGGKKIAYDLWNSTLPSELNITYTSYDFSYVSPSVQTEYTYESYNTALQRLIYFTSGAHYNRCFPTTEYNESRYDEQLERLNNLKAALKALKSSDTRLDVENYKSEGTYPEENGKIFSGWYSDANYTNLYRKMSGLAYPKYTNMDTLSVRLQLTEGATPESDTLDMRIITACDSLKYNNLGFKIDIDGYNSVNVTTRTVYTSIEGQTTHYPSEISEDAAYLAVYTIKNIPNNVFDNTFTITPYWVTPDGTTVDGCTRTGSIEKSMSLKVIFHPENGNENTTATPSPSGTVTAPLPEKDGYVFKGWYTEQNGQGTKLTAATKHSEVTDYYAYWQTETDTSKRNQILIGGFNGITEITRNSSGQYEYYATEDDFKLLAECGVDCIYMYYEHDNAQYKQYLEWLEKYGIGCYFSDPVLNEKLKDGTATNEYILNMTADYRNSPSFLGNYLKDEPTIGEFASLKIAVDNYHKALPDYEMYVNLLPNYADSGLIGGSFSDYVATYISSIDSTIVAQDTYPIDTFDVIKEVGNQKYYEGLYVTANAAKNSGRTHEIYIWTMTDLANYYQLYEPTITDFRFQAFNAMAFGASRISYFCFDTPPSYKAAELNYAGIEGSHGIIDQHKKSSTFNSAKQLTEEIKSLSNIYPEYQWSDIGVSLNGGYTDNQLSTLAEKKDYSYYISNISCSQTILIGEFDEINGPGYACMLVPQSDLNNPMGTTVSFRMDNAKTVTAYIGTTTQKLTAVNGVYTLSLEAAQAAYLTADLYR